MSLPSSQDSNAESLPQRELSADTMVGSFRIVRTLGVGGFGITYLATDITLNIQVAIKEYFPQNAWRDETSHNVHCYEGDVKQSFQMGLDRFFKEGQILAQFKHPNIVGVRQMLSANGTAYLVMDYVHGEDLSTYLQRVGRPLTYQETEVIFNPLLDGLRAIHEQGLLHLDIKPENIFLRSDSTPMLIDFGGSRHQLGQASRVVSFLVASDGYAPNEQYTGNQLQPSTDIYAVGASLYHCITGEIPADAQKRGVALIDHSPDPLDSIHQLVDDGQYPEYFLQAIDSSLSMRISERPQSIRELQQHLFQSQPYISSVSQQQPEPKSLLTATSPKTHTIPFWVPFVSIIGIILIVLILLSFLKLPVFNSTNDSDGKSRLIAEQTILDAQRQAALIKKQAELDAQIKQQKIQSKLDEIASKQAELEIQQQAASEKQRQELSKQQALEKEKIRVLKEEQSILSFVDDYVAISEQNDVDAHLNFYTQPVNYYSKESADYNFISKDAAHYMEIYPERKFHMVSTPDISWLSQERVLVNYQMSYELWRIKDGKTLQGTNLMTMILVKTDNEWKITDVKSKKLRQ